MKKNINILILVLFTVSLGIGLFIPKTISAATPVVTYSILNEGNNYAPTGSTIKLTLKVNASTDIVGVMYRFSLWGVSFDTSTGYDWSNSSFQLGGEYKRDNNLITVVNSCNICQGDLNLVTLTLKVTESVAPKAGIILEDVWAQGSNYTRQSTNTKADLFIDVSAGPVTPEDPNPPDPENPNDPVLPGPVKPELSFNQEVIGESTKLMSRSNITDLQISNVQAGQTYTAQINGVDATLGYGLLALPNKNGDYVVKISTTLNSKEESSTYTIRVRSPNIKRSECADIVDLVRVANSWGTANVETDLSGDGLASIEDMVLVSNNWGGSCV